MNPVWLLIIGVLLLWGLLSGKLGSAIKSMSTGGNNGQASV